MHGLVHAQVHGPALREYIRYRTGWTETQFDLVNWGALNRVMLSYPLYGRTTIMKAVYGWLHTSHWQERIYGTTSQCSMCNQVEDNEHLWTCPAQVLQRQTALETMLETLTDIGSPILVTRTLKMRLNTFLQIHTPDLDDEDHDPQTETQTTLCDTLFIQAGTEQDDLGWDNFLRGRHSMKWDVAYDEYIQTRPQRKCKHEKGVTWAAAMVKASLKLLTSIWASRNEEIHTRSDQEHSKQEHRIRTRVQETYVDRLQYPEVIRDTLFNMPLEERLEQDKFQLIKWLETVEQAQLSTTYGGTADIHRCYHPTRPPDLPQ